MKGLLLIGAGGFAGAVARYLISGWVQDGLRNASFPYGTLVVNAAGCFIIGLLSYLANERGVLTPDARLLMVIGFLGAFTTFSTYGNETLGMLRAGEWSQAFLNIGANNLLSLVAVWLGYLVPGLIWR